MKVLLASFEPRRDKDPNQLTLRSKANPHRERQAVMEPTCRDPKTLRADAQTPPRAFIRQIWRGPSGIEAFFETNGDAVTFLLLEDSSEFRSDGQLVRAVAQHHKRTPERMTVDGPTYLHKAPGAEELR
jgi:hypothetical protein